MNISILSITQVSSENIYMMDPKKNILMDGTFSKMIYIHPHFSMNGVYIHVPIQIDKIENFSFFKTTSKRSNNPTEGSKPSSSVKQTVSFSPEKHLIFISTMETLENNILDQYVPFDPNLPKIAAISQTLKSGYFRIFRETNKKSGEFILKISGIWENANGYGISYKMIETC